MQKVSICGEITKNLQTKTSDEFTFSLFGHIFEHKYHFTNQTFNISLLAFIERPTALSASPMCCALQTQCQEVRYDCIVRYRSEPQPAPLPAIDSSNQCRRPEIAPCSESQCFYLSRKHSCTAQPCQECSSVWLSVGSFVMCSSFWSLRRGFYVYMIYVTELEWFYFPSARMIC